MKLLLGIIIIFLFLGCTSNSELNKVLTNKVLTNKEAFIIGVSDYKGEKYDLPGVKKDRQKMKILFKKWGFNVTLLQDEQSMDIEKYLKNYSNLKPSDAFIFYYSGHGFHTKDVNGDEADGEDEALILSDGRTNKFFLDDTLFGYLNQVKAKKLVILDSCHSGTAFRSFNNGIKPKNIVANEISGVMKTRTFRPAESQISNGEYIIFSASQDEEQSLDTKDGGLFTNAFLKQFSFAGETIGFESIRQSIDESISEVCIRTNSIPHHPKLSVSNSALEYSSINDFFNIQTSPIEIISKSQAVIENKVSIIGRKIFKEKELLSFKINTNGNRGYLTIYSIEDNEPFILAKTTSPVSGVLNFQEDFNIESPIECYKGCESCSREVTSVYVVLSERPLDEKLIKMEVFMNQKHEGANLIIVKTDFTIY